MNVPTYSYSCNIKNDLLRFLQEANIAKNDLFCNYTYYDQIKTLIPLGDDIKHDLKLYMANINVCIDISQSDDETEQNCEVTRDNVQDLVNETTCYLTNSSQELSKTKISDIIDSINDTLSIQSHVSSITINKLTELADSDIDEIFSSLTTHLSVEDIENFWKSIINSNIDNDCIILCYVKYLFLPKVMEEFTDELQNIFFTLIHKYTIITRNELVEVLLKIGEKKETNRVIQQYIGMLENDVKKDILRDVIHACDRLYPSYIAIIDGLLNPYCNCDTLARLVEIMSNAVTEFISDNSYGKLLFNVVTLLERNISKLEQPLKHILGIHRSIWKIKLQKAISMWSDDSLTQSFV